MACRCAKISRTNNDISRTSNAREAIKSLRNMSETLDSRLRVLGRDMSGMATPDGMGACISAILNMNKGSPASIDAMIRQCDTRISALRSELDMLETEDSEFHQK